MGGGLVRLALSPLGLMVVCSDRSEQKVANHYFMEKLFIYLALAKPALTGQFVLFVSSQSKANASKYFCLFRCASRNKSSDF